jgi:hypothetical protein
MIGQQQRTADILHLVDNRERLAKEKENHLRRVVMM